MAFLKNFVKICLHIMKESAKIAEIYTAILGKTKALIYLFSVKVVRLLINTNKNVATINTLNGSTEQHYVMFEKLCKYKVRHVKFVKHGFV